MKLGTTSTDYASLMADPTAASGYTDTTQTTGTDTTGGAGNLSPQSMDALFGPGLQSQGSDPLAFLGTMGSAPAATSAPQPTSNTNVVGSLVSYAGQLYKYVQQFDQQGNAVAVPQPVAAAPGAGTGGGIMSFLKTPTGMIAAALGAYLLLG